MMRSLQLQGDRSPQSLYVRSYRRCEMTSSPWTVALSWQGRNWEGKCPGWMLESSCRIKGLYT